MPTLPAFLLFPGNLKHENLDPIGLLSCRKMVDKYLGAKRCTCLFSRCNPWVQPRHVLIDTPQSSRALLCAWSHRSTMSGGWCGRRLIYCACARSTFAASDRAPDGGYARVSAIFGRACARRKKKGAVEIFIWRRGKGRAGAENTLNCVQAITVFLLGFDRPRECL